MSGFDESYRRFREMSAGAKDRFEAADWVAVQRAVTERIRLEDEQVDRTCAQLNEEIRRVHPDEAAWRRAKLHFVEQRYSRDQTNWWIPNRAAVEAMLRSAGYTIAAHPEQEVFVCRHVDVPDDEPRAVYPARR